jgi:hypothetical protein
MTPKYTAVYSFAGIAEAAILSVLAAKSGYVYLMSAIGNDDWSRITGPNGVAFIAVIAVIVLWANGLRRERNEERRREKEEINREKRHGESIGLQRENAKTLIDLNVQSIKAQVTTSSEIRALRKELEGRPCAFDGDEKARPCSTGVQQPDAIPCGKQQQKH